MIKIQIYEILRGMGDESSQENLRSRSVYYRGVMCYKHFLPIIYHIILFLSIISFTFFVKIYIIIIFIMIDQ